MRKKNAEQLSFSAVTLEPQGAQSKAQHGATAPNEPKATQF